MSASRPKFGPKGDRGLIGPTGPPGPSDLSCGNITDVSNIYFCNGTAIIGQPAGIITISGDFDMSCNNIIDVSLIQFCTGGGGLDLSCTDITDVSNVYFCNDTALIGGPGGGIITISGDFDMSCNNIIDVSRIQFCAGGGGLDLSCTDITDVSNVYFCNDTALIGGPGGGIITISGDFDMSCNNIIDVSRIQFCAGGGGLDLSCTDITDVSNVYFCNDTALIGGPGGGIITISGDFDMSCNNIIDVSLIQFCTGGGGLDLSCTDITDVSNVYFCNDTALIGGPGGGIITISGDFDMSCNNIIDVSRIQFCAGGGGLDLSCTDITDVSNVYFCNDTALIGGPGGGIITISGDFDMSCNNIIDVSRIQFCAGGGGLDLSCTDITDVSNVYFCNDTALIGGPGGGIITISGDFDMSCNNIIDVSLIQFCTGGGGLDLSCTDITDVSNVYFCNDTALIGGPGGGIITISGDFDMSCNNIIDVSRIQFCAGGGGLDLSCTDITDVSSVYFCNNTVLAGWDGTPTTTYPGYIAGTPAIECSGNLDISCNNIVDVRYLTFCRGGDIIGWIGAGGSIDISSVDDINLYGTATDASINFSIAGTQEMRIDANHISVDAGSSANPSINFGLASGDTDTGIYRIAANQIGLSAGGTIELGISSAGASVQTGSAATPSYNFGLSSTDTDTGMYRVGSDTIGFSAGNEQKLTIAGSTLPMGMINGINIGTTSNIAGIQRLSATAANSWEDGHLGNSSALVFTANDFTSHDGRTPAVGAHATMTVRSASGGPGLVMQSSAGSQSAFIIASKLLPKGFNIPADSICTISATSGTPPALSLAPSWGETGNCTVEVLTQDINLPQINPTSLGAAVGLTTPGWSTAQFGRNTEYIIGGSASATGTGTIAIVIVIKLNPGAQMTQDDSLVGFQIPIARI